MPNDLPLNDPQEADRLVTYRSSDGRPAVRRRRWLGPMVAGALVVGIGIVIYAGIRSRADAEAELAQTTNAAAVPAVEVFHPKGNAPDVPLMLPGNTQAAQRYRHIRPHEWLPEEVVFRYWRSRKAWRSDGGDRNSGNRRSTAAGTC